MYLNAYPYYTKYLDRSFYMSIDTCQFLYKYKYIYINNCRRPVTEPRRIAEEEGLREKRTLLFVFILSIN